MNSGLMASCTASRNAPSSDDARLCLQAVSSRPDVAPPSYTRELEKLQDQIPPFPNSDAMAVIEEDTRQPITSIFSYISPEPVAAASLGQVAPSAPRISE